MYNKQIKISSRSLPFTSIQDILKNPLKANQMANSNRYTVEDLEMQKRIMQQKLQQNRQKGQIKALKQQLQQQQSDVERDNQQKQKKQQVQVYQEIEEQKEQIRASITEFDNKVQQVQEQDTAISEEQQSQKEEEEVILDKEQLVKKCAQLLNEMDNMQQNSIDYAKSMHEKVTSDIFQQKINLNTQSLQIIDNVSKEYLTWMQQLYRFDFKSDTVILGDDDAQQKLKLLQAKYAQLQHIISIHSQMSNLKMHQLEKFIIIKQETYKKKFNSNSTIVIKQNANKQDVNVTITEDKQVKLPLIIKYQNEMHERLAAIKQKQKEKKEQEKENQRRQQEEAKQNLVRNYELYEQQEKIKEEFEENYQTFMFQPMRNYKQKQRELLTENLKTQEFFVQELEATRIAEQQKNLQLFEKFLNHKEKILKNLEKSTCNYEQMLIQVEQKKEKISELNTSTQNKLQETLNMIINLNYKQKDLISPVKIDQGEELTKEEINKKQLLIEKICETYNLNRVLKLSIIDRYIKYFIPQQQLQDTVTPSSLNSPMLSTLSSSQQHTYIKQRQEELMQKQQEQYKKQQEEHHQRCILLEKQKIEMESKKLEQEYNSLLNIKNQLEQQKEQQ